jgi:hypothetical protein
VKEVFVFDRRRELDVSADFFEDIYLREREKAYENER